jgi:hypothetical protein
LRWADRELTLRPASGWRERYALAEGERELALFDCKGWGKRPVKVTILEPAGVEPGLLLFTAFVVRGLAEDANAAGAAAASTAATAGRQPSRGPNDAVVGEPRPRGHSYRRGST